MKKTKAFAMTLCLFVLSSCGLVDKLGFDTYDYMSETVTGSYDINSETAVMLEKLLGVLVLDSPVLETFDSMSDAIRAYRDAVLNYMLQSDYSKYSGNVELIEKAERAYPEYNITQIIPESEFEATMYRYFGGDVMITHRDGSRFKYLSKVGAYISAVSPASNGLHVDITSLEETAKTYRVRFRVLSEELFSEEYFALVIKREDGTYYIKKLLNSVTVR